MADAPQRPPARQLPGVAWPLVGSAMAALAMVLTIFSNGYGFDRDELYFRMLPPAWGYVDQPPLTPLLSRVALHVSASPWAQRVPATLFAVASVLVVVLITRELGGGRGAQGLCAWAYAFAAYPLLMGHVLLTTAVDLVVWPLLCLFAMRALLRAQPRWWLAFGVVVGLSTSNKWLVSLLLVALAAGLVLVGPWRPLLTPWLPAGALVAVLLALPNLVYQARHHWPQVTMSRALSTDNAGDVRVNMWWYLLILLGPPLVPIWIAGLVTLWRRRPARFLVVAFGVLLLETFLGGGQIYYPAGLLVVVFAAGCVPSAAFLARSTAWRRVAWVAIAINVAVAAVITLPLVPRSALADTPVPGINKLVGDEIGWPDYAAQIASVYHAQDPAHTAIITSNYGEAGALVRYAPDLPRAYSGHNELWFQRRPPDDTSAVVLVGGQVRHVERFFADCAILDRLHNSDGVDNEEEGEPVAVCHGPTQPWSTLWKEFQHYD
jgi:4-amino-4-deoxy-L-arabinose transferase-like glycosyltransferase